MNFDEGNVSDSFNKWRKVIDLMFTSPLASKSGAEKCSYLLLYTVTCYCQQGRDISKKDPVFLLNKFKEYCEPRKNITLERHKFFSRNQAVHEPIDLRLLSRSCVFGDFRDSLIRDRIVGGTNAERSGRC